MTSIARALLVAAALAPAAARADAADYRGKACTPRVADMQRRLDAGLAAIPQFLEEAYDLRSDTFDETGTSTGAVALWVEPHNDAQPLRNVEVLIDQDDVRVFDSKHWVAKTVAAIRRKHPKAIELKVRFLELAQVKPLLIGLSAIAPLHLVVVRPAPSPMVALIDELPAATQKALAAVPAHDGQAMHDALRSQIGACTALADALDAVATERVDNKNDVLRRKVPKALAGCGCDVPDVDLLEALVLQSMEVPGLERGWIEVRFRAEGAAIPTPVPDLEALVHALAAMPRDTRAKGVALP